MNEKVNVGERIAAKNADDAKSSNIPEDANVDLSDVDIPQDEVDATEVSFKDLPDGQYDLVMVSITKHKSQVILRGAAYGVVDNEPVYADFATVLQNLVVS